MSTGQQIFYDRILGLLDSESDLKMPLGLLAGMLNALQLDTDGWPQSRERFRNHALHSRLLADPYTSHAFRKPRGYPGDAALIDLIYDRTPPSGTPSKGTALFNVTTSFPVAEAVRGRRDFARGRLESAWRQGKSICALACGHLREADGLAGSDLTNITAVDQDAQSLGRVRELHGKKIRLEKANVFQFLRGCISRNERFDYLYTLGLTDYLDDREIGLLLKMMQRCMKPSGKLLVANFMRGHVASGWIDACMDWHLTYRDEADFADYAKRIGLRSSTFADRYRTIVYCELEV